MSNSQHKRATTAQDRQPASTAVPRDEAPSAFAIPMSPESWARMTRRQSEWALQSMADLCEGFESLRELQRDAAQASKEKHQAALTSLSQASSANDVFAVQAELMAYNASAWASYWQRLLGIAIRTETTMVKDAGSAMATSQEEGLRSVAGLFPGLTPPFSTTTSSAEASRPH